MPRNGSDDQGPPELNAKLSTDELVKRLKACSKYLSDCVDLKETNSSTLHRLSSGLLMSYLHNHRSREVKALTAACIVEVFRLFHPNHPYDDEDLKVVFSLFVAQLKGLENPTSAAFKQTFQLLECLVNLQVFLLCLSLEPSDTLAELFRMIFSVINDQQSSKVKAYLLEILVSVLQEGESYSQEILDSILSNIIDPVKTNNKAVYTFTVDLIRRASTHIEPSIHQFFNNALVVGNSSESELGDHLYDLIFELHAIESSILLAVLPQLEFKLISSELDERQKATQLLAKMFSPKGSKLAKENRPLWSCFLGRFCDANYQIRLVCVLYAKHFLLHHPHLVEDITTKLHERVLDKDEKVRVGVVKCISELANEDIKKVPQELRDDLVNRLRDKSWNVRRECMINLARLYRKLLSSSSSTDVNLRPSIVRLYSWIPTKLLHCYYLATPEDKLCVERCVLGCLVPVNFSHFERMQRLLHVYASLDDNANKAFDQMLLSRQMLRRQVLALTNALSAGNLPNDESRSQAITSMLIPIARKLPDQIKTQLALKDFVKILDGDDTVVKNLAGTVDTKSACEQVQKSKCALINQVMGKQSILDMIKNLVDACCPMLVDAKCIQVLVEQVCTILCDKPVANSQEEEEESFLVAKKGVRLLKVLASIMPHNFAASEVFEGLVNILNHTDTEIAKHTLQILDSVGRFVEQKSTSCLQPILTKFALTGPVELAKYSVRCIQHTFKEPRPILDKLCTNLVAHVEYDDPNFHIVLVSLGQVAKLQPEVFAPHHKDVIKNSLVKDLFVVDRDDNEYEAADEPEWCEDEEITYEVKAKVFATKLLVNWLLGDNSGGERSSLPVIRMLSTIIQCNGDLQQGGNISPTGMTRLRLAAACGLLKLAACPHYKDLITVEQFQSLACVIQDTCVQVRTRFATKLNKGLRSLKLPLRYLSIFVLAGTESSKAERTNYRNMVVSNVEQRRKAVSQLSKAQEHSHAVLPEYSISHAVYVIAHHPDFHRTNTATLDGFKDCLWFYLEPIVVKGDNYNFMYKLLETIKQTVDAQNPNDPEINKNIYSTCDLAMGVLASRITHIEHGDFAGEVVLPVKLYSLKKEKISKTNVKYLPPDYDCTPSKQAAAAVSTVKNEDEDTTPKKANTKKPTPRKRATTSAPKAKAPVSTAVPKRGYKTRGFTTSTPAVRPAKGKSVAKANEPKKRTTPRKRKQQPEESDMSDIEEEEDGEDTEDYKAVSPKEKSKEANVSSRRRNVRRKVLQNTETKEVDSDEGTPDAADIPDGGPSPAVPDQEEVSTKPIGNRKSNRRKAPPRTEKKASNHENQNNEKSDDEVVHSPRKRRKVDVSVVDKPKPPTVDGKSASSGIKRKTRHRR